MKAAVLSKTSTPLEIREVETPEPAGSEVVVRVASSGLCHTDLHIWQGHYGSVRIQDRGVKLPLILGHESAGTVAELGSDARARSSLHIGERVVVYPWIGEGSCKACISGDDNLCRSVKPLGVLADGGFAEYLKVPSYRYLVPSGELPLDSVAPMACAGITAYSALKKTDASPSDCVAILGIGGVGHLAVQLAAKILGANVIAVDEKSEAIDLAKKLGAAYAINSAEQDPAKEIARITGGAGADAVIDFVNTTETSSLGFKSLKRGGKIVLVGLSGESSSFPLPLVAMKGIGILGSYVGNLRDLIEVTHLLKRGDIEVTTSAMPLDRANDAIEMLHDRKVVGRIVLNP